MEEKYKQIIAIINRLAASNPYITREQITKAKSMYNGDDRPIEVIKAELEAYSAQIEARGKKSENDKVMGATKNANQPFKKPENSSENPSVTGTVHPVVEENINGIIPPRPKYIPAKNEVADEPQNELEKVFDFESGPSTYNDIRSNSDENWFARNPKENSAEKPKVLVKTQSQTSPHSTGDDSGYGNLAAILSLTIIFSIITIIMSFFTIILK